MFKTKRDPDGSTQYKVRLVHKGYEQMDYSETYTLVGKLTTFRLLITLTTCNNWRIDQLDIFMAFLNPEVDDDTLFMELQGGWLDEIQISDVQLRKALYGLNQVPHL